MNSPVKIQSIDIYPMKSLEPHSLQNANILSCGALQGDRCWAMVDEQGKYINGKRTPLIHSISSRFDASFNTIEIAFRDGKVESSNEPRWQQFELPAEKENLEQILSKHFGYPVFIQQDTKQGFPDDLDAPGPTLIGSASLEIMTQWFPGLTVPQLKKRFRANIVLETAEPFWEDRLFGPPESPRRFRVGDVELLGVNPCQRCVVPSRDSVTGEVWGGFQKEFARLRKESLPDGTAKEHFNHYYRFAVNTRISPDNKGASISCGDVVELL